MRRRRGSQLCFLVLGILSIFLHASVLAWHPFAGSWNQRADLQLVADLVTAICHGGGATETNELPADRGVPIPNADCLFCSGFANASLVILSSTETGLLARASSRISDPTSSRAVAAAPVFAPRNRGPPHLT
jgi:hypothetical protein